MKKKEYLYYLLEDYYSDNYTLKSENIIFENVRMEINDGDIYTCFFPYLDTNEITVDHQHRPAVMINDKDFGLSAIQLSKYEEDKYSKIKKLKIPYNYLLQDTNNGLNDRSIFIGSSVRQIKDIKLKKYIGKLSESDKTECFRRFNLFKSDRDRSVFVLLDYLKWSQPENKISEKIRSPKEILDDNYCNSFDICNIIRFICNKFKIPMKTIILELNMNEGKAYQFYSIFEFKNSYRSFRYVFGKTNIGSINDYKSNKDINFIITKENEFYINKYSEFYDIEYKYYILDDNDFSYIDKCDIYNNAIEYLKTKFIYSEDKTEESFYNITDNLDGSKIINENGLIYRTMNLTEKMIFENNSLINFTMYHGSQLKLTKLYPTGYNAGHIFKKQSWSVFLFRNYNLAFKWAMFKRINYLMYFYKFDTDIWLYFTEDDDLKMFIHYKDYEDVCRYINKDKPHGYVYTVKVPLDSKLSVGNLNSIKEFTYDGELSIDKRDRFTITEELFKEYVSVCDDDMYNNRESYYKNIRGLLGYIFYPKDKVFKKMNYIYDQKESGNIKPGDDLDEFTKDYDKENSF